MTHIRSNSDMQCIHSYSLALASYSVTILNLINVMKIEGVQKEGYKKRIYFVFKDCAK